MGKRYIEEMRVRSGVAATIAPRDHKLSESRGKCNIIL